MDVLVSSPLLYEPNCDQLKREIEEKDACIVKRREREQYLEDALSKRTTEFSLLEEKLQQFDEKTRTFEQLHHLQVQAFEKTIHDCQIENDRLCEHNHDLTRELHAKSTVDAIDQEKILTFDRIVADTQLWRQKLDSYKATIEQQEKTISDLKNELESVGKERKTNAVVNEHELQQQVDTLQKTLTHRNEQIKHLTSTLRRIRNTLQPNQLAHDNPSSIDSSTSPMPGNDESPALDNGYFERTLQALTDRLTSLQESLARRDEQVAILKKVHDNRWLRLKHLQKQYRSLVEELRSYVDDDEDLVRNTSKVDSSHRKAVRTSKAGFSACNDHRWRWATGRHAKGLKQEDGDAVLNEVSRLRRNTVCLANENLTLHEKIDVQSVELNELRHELQSVNARNGGEPSLPFCPASTTRSTDEQARLIEELDRKLYELESERAEFVVERERLKTDFGLCMDEKQLLMQQHKKLKNELRRVKLRTLALQDQIERLKRDHQATIVIVQRRTIKKKARRRRPAGSCLQLLLDRNTSLANERRHSSSNLADHRSETSSIKRGRKASVASTLSTRRCGPFQSTPARLRSDSQRLTDLADAREENQRLQQRLSAAFNRIRMLKAANQVKSTESNSAIVPVLHQHDSGTENLRERLRNTSFDAAHQRKLNKTLQVEIETLNRSVESLTEKLSHTERDVAGKRLLIDNYKVRLIEMEANLNRSTDRSAVEAHDERVKVLSDTADKLGVSLDSYKNRLQVVAREKHDVDGRFARLVDEHERLKNRFDEAQSKLRFSDQQLRQTRLQHEQSSQDLLALRHSSEQHVRQLSSNYQETSNRCTTELDQIRRRVREYETFIKDFLGEMIRRRADVKEHGNRTRERTKQRESLSITLPGFDAAMNTASKILNLTQDDLDEIMSITDNSFQVYQKLDYDKKSDAALQKLAKLLMTEEELAVKLLKLFSKQLDKIQVTDRELAVLRQV